MSTPATLPADFFTRKKKDSSSTTPATLPKDFFAKAPKSSAATSATPPVAKAPSKTPQEAGPVGFEESFRASMGFDPKGGFTDDVKQIFSGLGEEFAHPITSIELLAHSLWDMHQETAQKGISRMQQPGVMSKVTGATQYLESGVPLGGPLLSQAGEQAEKKDFSGMLGTMTPLMMGETLGKIARIPEAVKSLGKHTSIVDGSLKASADVAKKVGANPSEALTTAHKLTEKAPNRILKRRTFEDAYVHSKGLDIAKKITKAAKAVQEEVKTHASGIASQIDTKIPTGVIDASAESATILKEFQDVVKTPEKAHPVLIQMVKDAQVAATPKMWSWEKARQFRSSVGRAMSGDKVVGPQKVVLTKIYIDLTKKLAGTAKQYGLEKSWNQYNELASKMDKEFSDITDGVTDSKSGQEVAQKLSKDVALTSELSKNLSKYGLKHVEVLQFVNTAKRIAQAKNFMNRSLFRLVYGSVPGLTTAMTLRMSGAPYIAALAGGATVGLTSSYLVSLARVLRLSPDIIESMMRERELPGKMKFEEGVFPSGEEGPAPKAPPQLPEPKTPAMSPEELSKAKKHLKHDEPLTRLPGEETEAEHAIRTRGMKTPPSTEPPAKAPDVRSYEKEPPVEATKAELGKHGTGKLAEQSKARERITKNRGLAKRTKEAQATEAAARAQATHMDVSQLQIPEMEEYLWTKNPTTMKGLTKMRKLGTPDVEYIEALKYLILEDLEK